MFVWLCLPVIMIADSDYKRYRYAILFFNEAFFFIFLIFHIFLYFISIASNFCNRIETTTKWREI